MYSSKTGVVGRMCQLWHSDCVVLPYASRDTVLQIVIGHNRISGHWCSLYWFSPIGLCYGECVCWKCGSCIVKYFFFLREIRASKCWRVASKTVVVQENERPHRQCIEFLMPHFVAGAHGWEPSNPKCCMGLSRFVLLISSIGSPYSGEENLALSRHWCFRREEEECSWYGLCIGRRCMLRSGLVHYWTGRYQSSTRLSTYPQP